MARFSRQNKKLIRSRNVFIAVCLAGAFFLFSLIFVLPLRVLAQTGAEQAGLTAESGFGQVALGKGDIKATVASIINIVLGVLGIIAVGLIVYAGFLWMTAGGNEDKVAKAKLIMRNAAIGLVIIMSAWGIASFIISRLGSATSTGVEGCVGPNCPPPRCTGPNCGITGEDFTLKEFQTTHAGTKSSDDVYLCSSIQSRFNHWLNLQSIDTLRGLQQPALRLSVWKTGEYDAVAKQYKNFPLPRPPEQLTTDIKAGSNVLGFIPPGTTTAARGDWPINSQFEIHVPKLLTDASDEPLADCTALGCNDRTTYFSWNFTTTAKRDEIKPALTSSYPRLDTATNDAIEGYPDRDVDRSITFTLNFSEEIDFFSAMRADGRLNPENIKVEQVASGEPAAAIVAAIPSEHFDVSASTSGLQFALNESHQSSLNDGPYLEPYTWYRITVQNLTDLCGNSLDKGPVAWIFQTNGNIPGVAFVYPADGYQYACPSTETFVQFRTSMYDVKTLSCAVPADASKAAVGGLVRSGQGVAGRTLSVSNDKPPDDPEGQPVNPNNYCKRYDFAPAAAGLTTETDYTPVVKYRNPANDAQTQTVSPWTFRVKPPDQCANAPYISALSPSTGPWGRCLTVQGNYFANTPGGDGRDTARNGSDAYVKLNLESGRNQMPTGNVLGDAIRNTWTKNNQFKSGVPLAVADINWFNIYATDEMPNVKDRERLPGSTAAREDGELILLPPGKDNMVDFNFFVVRNATLGGTLTPLTSNLAGFVVPTNEAAYQGPCLYSISPNVGPIAMPVTLTGTRLGDSPPVDSINPPFTRGVLFASEKKAIIATPQALNWTSTLIKTTVPIGSVDGDVVVKTSQGLSNGLPFDVANSRNEPCTKNADCTGDLVCIQGRCAEPPGFRIVQTWPTAACGGACPNAEVSLITNMKIKPTSPVPAVLDQDNKVTSGNISVRECNEDCQSLKTGQVNFPAPEIPAGNDTKLVFTNFALGAGKRYRVIVYGGEVGLRAADGKQLSYLNYDADANGANDSYSWYFTVGANDCAVDRVDTNPSSLGLYERDPGEQVLGTAYSKPDSCSSEGQVLNVTEGFEWKSCKYTVGDIRNECIKSCALAEVSAGNAILGFAIDPTKPTENTISGANGTPAGARALACLFYGAGAIKDGTVVTVYPKCTNDAQCQQGSACASSICNKTGPANLVGHCTPVIKDFSPESGAPGTWVTLNGCWFGNQRGTVKYNNADEFLEPANPACTNTWSDKEIIAEAPDDIVGKGKLTVKTAGQNSQSAESIKEFEVKNTEVHPGLCLARPNYGAAGTEVELHGQNFGDSQIMSNDAEGVKGDQVQFKDTVAAIKSWSDDLLKVAVPELNLTAEALKVAITVLKAAIASNPKDFNALQSGPGRGCPGSPGCPVAPQDLKVESYQPPVTDPPVGTPPARQLACLNMVEEVVLDGLVDGNSVALGKVASTTTSNFVVHKVGGVNNLAGEVWLDYLSNASTTLSFILDEPLLKSTDYQIILKSGESGLRSTSRGVLTAGVAGTPCAALADDQCVINFKTISGTPAENAECAAAGLQVAPTNPYFTCAGDNCEGDFLPNASGHQRLFHVRPQARNGQTINLPGAVFDWTSSVSDIVALQDPSKTERAATTTIGKKDGVSRIKAVLQGTGGGDPEKAIQGASDVTVFLCDNPWPAKNGGLFQPYGDADTNFSTYYCRDRGAAGDADDLPVLNNPIISQATARAEVPDLLKELFFLQPAQTGVKFCQGGDKDKQACIADTDCLGTDPTPDGKCLGKSDAIGIRVLKNMQHFTTGEWYNGQIFNKGAPSPIILDGYEGLRDGRTVYASAPNQSAPNQSSPADGNKLYTNIYLLSYNDAAHPDTVNIVNQMVENMSFAVNITDPLDKDKLRRDVKRWSDARILADGLVKKDSPIKLASGTFIAGKSNSAWPSWQETLGRELGGRLPIDPINELKCPVGYDQKTCFDKSKTPKFQCDNGDNGSQAYFYRYDASKTTLTPTPEMGVLGLKLEYAPPSRWAGFGAPWFEVAGSNTWCANLEYRQMYE